MQAVGLAAAELGDVLAGPQVLAIDVQLEALALHHLRLEAGAPAANHHIRTHERGGLADLAEVGIEAVGGVWVQRLADELPFSLDGPGRLADRAGNFAEVAVGNPLPVPPPPPPPPA